MGSPGYRYRSVVLSPLGSMERILFGVNIDDYLALDLAGIGVLNDAVGGVEVTCLETINNLCVEGEKKTLRGKEAQLYVQYRDTTKFNSDESRRARQIQYARAFAAKAMSEFGGNPFNALGLLGSVKDFACTNIGMSEMVELYGKLENVSPDLKDEDIRVLEGEAVMGERYMEYRLDETAAFETLLEVLYEEQN